MAGGRPSFEDTKKGGNFQYLSTARCNKMLIVVRDADQGVDAPTDGTAMNSRLLPIWNASGIALAMTRSAGVIVDQWQYDITRSFFLDCFGIALVMTRHPYVIASPSPPIIASPSPPVIASLPSPVIASRRRSNPGKQQEAPRVHHPFFPKLSSTSMKVQHFSGHETHL